MEIELSEVVVLSEQDDPLKPQQNSDAYIRPTPIKTRSKGPVTPSSCRPSDEGSTNREFDDGDDDDNSGNSGLDPDSPIAGLPRRNPGVMVVLPRQSTQKGKDTQNKRSMAMQYCTQKCLLGLLNGSPLDRNCPNVASHGNGEKHTLDCHEFRRLVRAQVLRKDRGPFGCESMHIHGTSGALFHLTLFSHGYTLVAKGVPVEMVNRAKYEEYIYRHLHPIQGAYVPVCLGSIDISTRPLWYDGIAEIVHLLFLGYAGRRIKFHAGDGNLKQFVPSASESLQAIHGLGVLHGDAHTSNMFWNAEMERVMVIDFERAKIFDRPVYAKTAALMKKRKRGETSYPAATRTKSSSMALFKQELQRLESNLISS
ncbi:hypothetical protein FQN57_002021 [Myotisia sp. PD_48]|nr:hypothetical protein FQN57_002021 [Myotisia sp. PD_48]